MNVGLDSVEIIMELEDQFRISIDDTKAERVRTVGDLVRLVSEHIGLRLPPADHLDQARLQDIRDRVHSIIAEQLAVDRAAISSMT